MIVKTQPYILLSVSSSFVWRTT